MQANSHTEFAHFLSQGDDQALCILSLLDYGLHLLDRAEAQVVLVGVRQHSNTFVRQMLDLLVS